jgi:D-beta-D-heptose 7-phosphate kinase/D-beta-D-heptose 1-phosphate adenosyltransferase
VSSYSELLQKQLNWQQAGEHVQLWKSLGEKVVFTNGCFDLLHPGHVTYLAQARDLGHHLVVGLNSDKSVQKLKGTGRPVQNQQSRAMVLAGLASVDAVVVFEQETPFELISLLMPDVLCKGGDYTLAQIIGADVVLAAGGNVVSLPFVLGHSTSSILARIG